MLENKTKHGETVQNMCEDNPSQRRLHVSCHSFSKQKPRSVGTPVTAASDQR